MEHWMTERSTIYTLIGASQGQGMLLDEAELDESIDAAFRVRAREKALRLAQQVFYGSLELSLFSKFDIRGDENILGLQHRMANDLIPHDLPDKKDIKPLLDVFRENASGRQVGWYRYLWCDVLSATVFDRFKDAYSEDAGSLLQLKRALRRVLLEPGAYVKPKEILREFQLEDCSPDALFERYKLK
jgi:Zn-dependent oligopeptidase